MKKHVISKSFETPVKGLSICASICACIVVLLFIAAGVQPGWTEANMKHVNKVAVQPVKDAKKMTGKRMISPGFGNIPLYFIPNKGQMHENALFCAKTPRYNLWLTKEGLVFDSMKKAEIKAAHPAPSGHPSQEGNHAFSHSPHSPKTRRDVSRLIFLKANKNPLVVPGEPTAHRVNYLKGSDKSKWHNGIPTSRAVCYKNLYKKIDLKVYGAVKQIEYDWVIKPGGNPADIRFQYQGVNNVSIDENGNLAIETTFGQWSHKKPLAYQVLSMEPGAGSKEAVDVTFKKLGNNCYGFNVGDYDRDRELIIDPMVIAFSTYLGGSSADYLNGMVIDGTGAIYVTGDTVSSDFPTQDAYQGTLAGAGDVFVSKLSYDGKSLVFSTYLGGSGSESAIDIVLDSSGNIYIGGSTSSTDFPTVNAFQAANAGEDDGFAAKLSADGSSLLYSTYLGGSQYDYIYAIAISGSGEICVTGVTYSSDFPVENALQPTYANNDVFVTKFSSSGVSLVFSTYLGGSDSEESKAICVDNSGAIYVGGATLSHDFPTVNAFQDTMDGTGHSDGYISKIAPDGSSLSFSTYLGGSEFEQLHDIDVDNSGNVYTVGISGSSDFPTTPGAFQETKPRPSPYDDTFVTKISAYGSNLIYSTFLGGTDGFTEPKAITVTSDGSAYVTGRTSSTSFPLLDAFQDTIDGWEDVFITGFSPDGTGITFSSYLGGHGFDIGNDIAVDTAGNIYVAGNAEDGFPVFHGFQNSPGDYEDGFITKIVYSDIADITVTAPNGGEEWIVRETHNITWTAPVTIENVRIEYYSEYDYEWVIITESTPNDGSYSWTIPDKPSSQCLVQVYDADWGNYQWDESDAAFTISPLEIEVTSPNGGEEWQALSARTITWTASAGIQNVRIEYSIDDWCDWYVITQSTPNTGSYDWIIPDTPSSECRVQIYDADGYVMDESDESFTILPNSSPTSITVNSPNGGEEWYIGSSYDITWSYSGPIEYVSIDYSTDGGSSWNPVVTSILNNGYYSWTVPTTPSTNCLVRVIDDGGSPVDVSDNVFTIPPPPGYSIEVTSPHGGENWEAGTRQTISWSSGYAITDVSIDYSTDGGNTWTPVLVSKPDDGYYDWTVPNTPSGNCLVRVSDVGDISSDVSDSTFTISPASSPFIAVTSPNGGEKWFLGTQHEITWTYSGDIEYVSLEYSTDNGYTWNPIAGSVPNNGSYTWTLPITTSTNCLVTVYEPGWMYSDESDDIFTIAASTIPEYERYALIALYNNTGGDSSWDYKTNWRDPQDPTQFNDHGTEHCWHGITCNEEGTHVIEINFPINWLYGDLPDLSDLTELKVLNLYYSGLWGDNVPAWLNNLTNLTLINLSDCQFIGPIPDLSNLTQLEVLSLSDNDLTGSIPASLNNLTGLKRIELYENGLTGTIPDLSNLTNLTYLDLNRNALTGPVPGWLNQLTNLTHLDLWWNQLSGTIPDLSSLTQLTNLNLSDNQLTGDIPAWFNQLANLQKLYLGNNQLTGIIPGLSNLTQLTELGLPNNQLTGTIPDLSNFPNLFSLDLSNNRLTGSIPAGIGNFSTLNYLFLHSNQLTGSIPGSMSDLTNLNDYNGLNIMWNVLYTYDTGLRDFLNSKQLTGDWESTQTTAPTGLAASQETHDSVKVSWTPIPYQAGTGGYNVYYSTTSGSGYTLAGAAADKSVGNYTVTGLEPDTTYYFVAEAFTDPHADNQNTVTSEYSTEVSGATLNEPSLTVTAPNGGESWEGGFMQTITWTSTGSIANVMIEYSMDNGTSWNTINGSTTNSGTYNWAVPNTPSNNCLVRISDTAGPAADTSDAVFTILQRRTVTVTAPNSGENWEAVTVQTITWSSTGGIPNVMIEYSADNGSSWNTITGSTTNTGSYDWTIPNTPSSNCLVRISDIAGPASDISDAVFNILEQRTITVTVPNGGEDWDVDSVHDITWTTTGPVGNVDIDYSADGGSSWNSIVSSTANTGTYSWTVPDTPSSDCLVRITDTAAPAADASDAVFTISTPMISSSERDVLIALYNSTNGDSWTDNTNWRKPGEPTQFNDPGTEHTWYGVTCNVDNTQVEKVELGNNNLVGTIPAELDQLLYLNTLNLSENQLSGTIPTLGNLIQLENFILENNALTGSVPTWLNNLGTLKDISLGHNQLSGTIPDLSSLSQLNTLSLSDNQLTGGIPAWLDNLTGLNTLNLGSNQLTGTITDLGSLTNLNELFLNDNQLTGGIPAWINNLTGLNNLNLALNQLTGNIPDLSSLINLVDLKLHSNQLTGAIPSWISGLTGLKNLELQSNQLSGNIPADLGNLTTLETLFLNGNQLIGDIPAALTNLTNLPSTGLNISWNGLYTDDTNLRDFLNTKSSEDWEATQTIAPGGLSSSEESQNSVKVSWTPIQYQGDSGEYRVYYSTTSGSGYTLAGTTADKTEDNYTVTGLAPDTTYYFVVETVTESHAGNQNTVLSEYSTEISAATIEEPTLTVTAPNGGESWEANTVQTITWASTGNINDVKIESSTDNGTSWNTVIASTANSGSHNWTVPNSPSGNCLVRISDIDGPAIDTSNAVFTILQQRTLTVTAPNGNENWEAVTVQTITWSSTGGIPNVMIEYSADNGGSWNTITGSTTNTGSYDWTIPNTPSSDCLVKISDIAGPAFDISDAVFNILEQRTITVTVPNGGEDWQVDSIHDITWTTTGAVGNVAIDYTTDNGSSWNSIVSSTANTGTYSWTVPDTPSGDCLVRISDTTGPASDNSNAVFSISIPTISSTQRDALIALYNNTNGDSWTDNTNWRKTGEPTQFNDPGTEHTWYGVTCNVDNTQVEKVELSNNSLVGTIPAELDQLLYLNTLNLNENQLSGTIPTLGNLTQLENFILENNALTGSVPTWLNNPGTLKDISLGHNQLSGTIPDLSSLSQLNTLSLGDNQLTGGIPAWLDNLTGLNALNLGSNQLTGIITDLGSLTNLNELSLHDNLLTGGIPAWVNNLTGLNTLNLALNQLTGNIPDLSSLTNLIDLKLHSNQLTGAIPSWISVLTSLKNLELQSNQLSGNIPAELGNLTALENLFLNGNQLIGDIPAPLTNLTNLLSTGLNISWNGLYTDDTNLRDFLNSKSSEDWEATQTIAPGGLSSSEENLNSVKVSWTPIPYQGDTGEYRVYYSTTSGGGYTLAGTTADKTEDNYTVTGLDPSTTYYFVVETVTESHSGNQNTVISEYSTEISAATLEEPTLTVTAPNGGETCEANTVQTITWASTGNISDVNIESSTDNGNTWNTVIASTANSGSYDWTIPNTPSANCLVKISDVGGPAQDQSDAVFTIAEQRTLTVTAPDGGENWEGNTSQNITWNSTGSIANVKIEYSTDNGSSWNTITGSTANDGSHNWTVPNTPSSSCLVKVSDTAGPASDVSDAVFTIAAQQTVTVTSPNGGESWDEGTTKDITWTYTGTIANVDIDYSTNGGTSWNSIVGSTPNTGSYNWVIPAEESTNCLVRVSDTETTASDTGDAVFAMWKQPSITVTAPNGGETWKRFTTQTITWTNTGNIQDVKIQYSINAGGYWKDIVSSTPNNGSYQWYIPNVNQDKSQCLVRIMTLDAAVLDTSDSYFTITKF